MLAKKLGFIGAGNITSAIIGGLIANHYPPELIYASAPTLAKLTLLKQRYGIHISTDNAITALQAEVLILAVKPQLVPSIAKQLAPLVQQSYPLVISIIAGISVASLADYLGNHLAIIRCMPNMPVLLQQGISGLYANTAAQLPHREQAEHILQAVGKNIWVNTEDDINKITAISGSGPAYCFYFMEALQAAAEQIGLEPSIARQLTLQTMLGAAMLAAYSDASVAELCKQVTSPGGTTEKALTYLQQKNFKKIIAQAVSCALDHARALAS